FTALALQVGIHIGQLTLTLDTLGFRQYWSVFVELLCVGAQPVGPSLQIFIALLEFGFDLCLSLLRRVRVSQNAFWADTPGHGRLLGLSRYRGEQAGAQYSSEKQFARTGNSGASRGSGGKGGLRLHGNTLQKAA